jgi:hypothetical protein
MDTVQLGEFSAFYQLSFTDENLPGMQNTSLMNLVLTGNVVRRFQLHPRYDVGVPDGGITLVPEPSAWVVTFCCALVMGNRRRFL